MKNQPKITEVKQSTDRRIDVKMEDGKEFAIIVQEDGRLKIYTHMPHLLGEFVAGQGCIVKVDHYGHPYED